MAQSLGNIIKYLYPALVPFKDYLIEDDGTGEYIKAWTNGDPQPTAQEILNAEPQVQYEADLKEAWVARYNSYPSVEDRLHAIIMAINTLATATSTFLLSDMITIIDDIETVDAANPLPPIP